MDTRVRMKATSLPTIRPLGTANIRCRNTPNIYRRSNSNNSNNTTRRNANIPPRSSIRHSNNNNNNNNTATPSSTITANSIANHA
jgi:hypothetical protein